MVKMSAEIGLFSFSFNYYILWSFQQHKWKNNVITFCIIKLHKMQQIYCSLNVKNRNIQNITTSWALQRN